jgi:hypothetical protein
MLTVTLIAITLQVVFGFIVGGIANYPSTATSISSIGDLLSAMWSAAGPSIMLHAFWGVLVVLMGVGTTRIALRYHKRNVTATSALGLVSLVVALLGGFIFASSDFVSGGGILLMVGGVLGAYAFLFLALRFAR